MNSASHVDLMSRNERTFTKGVELVRALEDRGVRARLMGGAGIFLQTADLHPWFARVGRTIHDLDLVCRSSDRMSLPEIMLGFGYSENERLNRLHGRRRQVYWLETGNDLLEVDFFFDELPMCHLLDLRRRLDAELLTLWPVDLLLTKLQIVELNRKDVIDATALLASSPLDDEDRPHTIARGRIANIVSGDWGWFHTLEINLARVRAHLPSLSLSEELSEKVSERVEELMRLITTTPKSVRWRLRAQIGERARWYQPVEDLTR